MINRYLLILLSTALLSIASVSIYANDQSDSLSNSASPYVTMHASDKVRWLEWDVNVLKQAREQQKLIFVTVGYFSCYWCHVLQKETFQHSVTADFVNSNFIAAVVDRELFPSLDAHFVIFAEKTIGRSGWPLNVILTPDGYPLMATVYLPQKNFYDWLKQANDLWIKDPDYLMQIAKNAAVELNANFSFKSEEVDEKLIRSVEHAFVAEVLSVSDDFDGGFGDQAKFPLPSILQSLLFIYQQTKDERIKKHVILTLRSMRKLGLYDHLAGGFFRYTTGPDWQVPHFEKMLYDNAQLASVFLQAGKLFKFPEFTKTGIDTLDYLIENFRDPNGGFYSSYSAVDETGIEGGYYLWSKSQIKKILTDEERKLVGKAWGWGNPPLLDEGYFPLEMISIEDLAEQSTAKSKTATKEISAALQSIRTKLLKQRNKRKLPRDEKILTSWNALMLIALIDGYELTGNNHFKLMAARLVAYIETALLTNDKLQRSDHLGVKSGNADLEDYAYLANALNRWQKINPTIKNKMHVARLVKYAWQHFYSPTGWALSDDLLIPNTARESMLSDGPLPSASAMLIKTSIMINLPDYAAQLKQAMGYGHRTLKQSPFWYGSQVQLLSKYQSIDSSSEKK